MFRHFFNAIMGHKVNPEESASTIQVDGISPSSSITETEIMPMSEIRTPELKDLDTSIQVIPRAFDVLNGDWISLTLKDARFHNCGVFSNVYYAQLIEPKKCEVAIKKVWPKKGNRHEEMLLLAAFRKLRARNVAQLLYMSRTEYKEGRTKVICETYYMQFQDESLDQIIKASKGIHLTDAKLYAWQMFNGLDFLATNNIMHRDLKPVNILANRRTGELQIADFGSAKVLKRALESSTGYQVTRYYRPPELLYSKGVVVYDWRVDLWSAGCVLAEMLSGTVLFPSRDIKHQQEQLQCALGVPKNEDMYYMKIPHMWVADAVDLTMKSVGLYKYLELSGVKSSEAQSFIAQLLVFNPMKRIHGTKVLTHVFFDILRSETSVTTYGVSTKSLLLRQTGAAKRPYDFIGMIANNRRTTTPDIRTPVAADGEEEEDNDIDMISAGTSSSSSTSSTKYSVSPLVADSESKRTESNTNL